MQLRDDMCLDSAVRTLADIVRPAVDADDVHAREQLEVVIGLLSLMRERQALAWRYDLDELARLLDFSRALAALDARGADGALQTLAVMGTEVLSRAQAGPDEVRQASRALREASGALAAALYADGEPELRARVQRLVLDNAAEQLTRERAWFAPQGWELDPAALPPIETLLK